MANIVSIVPYKFLPPVNGGHWGVIIVEKILSIFNKVHTVATVNNTAKAGLPFQTHFVLPNTKQRYLPYSGYKTILTLAQELKADYLFCHHHYLYFTAKKVAKKLGVPLYIRCHNIEAHRFRDLGKKWWKIMYYYERLAFRNSQKIFFVTQEDRDWAVKHYQIQEENGIVMPFSIDFNATPKVMASKTEISAEFGLRPGVPWLFFMGQLDYKPNENAVLTIVNDILPLLRNKLPEFQILILGKNLAQDIQDDIQKKAQNKDILHLGFVPELAPFLALSDIMMNPVLSGGGVKTKVVESLAWNKTVVSTHSGAIGIEKSVCGQKLQISKDNDWKDFTDKVEDALNHKEHQLPESFFSFYYAQNVAERVQQYFN